MFGLIKSEDLGEDLVLPKKGESSVGFELFDPLLSLFASHRLSHLTLRKLPALLSARRVVRSVEVTRDSTSSSVLFHAVSRRSTSSRAFAQFTFVAGQNPVG